MIDSAERVRERAARPGLAPLWDELARRFGASDTPVTRVTLRNLDERSQKALADLLASDRLLTSTCRLTTARIAGALNVDVDGLRCLVEQLRGPIPNRSAQRIDAARRREELWSWLSDEVRDLGIEGWVARLRNAGIPGGDVDSHRSRLCDIVAVLRRLPADGVALPSLASDVLGDPHALDHGTWTGRAVVDAIAAMHQRPAPRTAEEARREWASVGVAADMLSPTVLTLGFSPEGESPLAQMLRTLSANGEPAGITLSQLRRWPLQLGDEPGIAYVFENPSIPAEAARMQFRGAPLVCSSGWPNVAVTTLLRQIAACGWELNVHCDFDVKGIQIARWLSERVDARPWRMRSGDYLAAVNGSSIPITGSIPDTPWDGELSAAMRIHQRAVFEEDIREILLTDVSQAVR